MKKMSGNDLLLMKMFVCLVSVVLVSGSCARKDRELDLDGIQIVWPLGSVKPRIKYVRTISHPADLGIADSFFKKMGRLFTGKKEQGLVLPMAIAVTDDGKLYIADSGAQCVHLFDIKETKYNIIYRRNRQPFPSPVGLALGTENEVYITDSFLEQVYILMPDTDVAHPVPLGVQCEKPTGIAVDSVTGGLFIVDTGSHSVKVFNRNGSFRFQFGKRGNGNGEFNFPIAVCKTDSGRVYVLDSLNFRVQVFDDDGNFISKFGNLGDSTGTFSRPKGIAIDHSGHIYIVDALFQAVQIFDIPGNFLLSFGTHGSAPGQFWLPAGIFISRDGMIYIADSHNKRIQVFKYIGDSE